VPFRPPKTQQ